MKKLTIKIAFLLTAAEVSFLNGLGDFTPTTKLSTTDARTLSNIYYRVFNGEPKLMELALKTKWHSGERKKTQDAQRDILNQLRDIQALLEPGDDITLVILDLLKYGPENMTHLWGTVIEVAPPATKTTIDVVINGSIFALQSGEPISYTRLCAIAGQTQGAKVIWRRHGSDDNQPSYEVTAGGYAEPTEGDLLWITASTPVPDAVPQEGDGPTTHGANA